MARFFWTGQTSLFNFRIFGVYLVFWNFDWIFLTFHFLFFSNLLSLVDIFPFSFVEFFSISRLVENFFLPAYNFFALFIFLKIWNLTLDEFFLKFWVLHLCKNFICLIFVRIDFNRQENKNVVTFAHLKCTHSKHIYLALNTWICTGFNI